MSTYPEHEKLQAVSEQSQAIGEFLDFGLPAQGIYLAEVSNEDGELWLSHKPIQKILADYFEIDLKKIEDEKRAMLDAIRAAQP